MHSSSISSLKSTVTLAVSFLARVLAASGVSFSAASAAQTTSRTVPTPSE